MRDVSDHCLVCAQLNLTKTRVPVSYRSYRDYSKFVFADFVNDLFNIDWNIFLSMGDVNDLVHFFNREVTGVFDLHAPWRTSRFTKAPAPWLTDNVRLMMSLRKKSLAKYKRLKTEAALGEYKQLRNFVTTAIRNEKRAYLNHKFRTDPGGFWKTLKNLNICKRSDTDFRLSGDNVCSLANNFFIDNVPTIPGDSNNFIINEYKDKRHPKVVQTFNFIEVSDECIEEIISGIKSSAMGCDGIDLRMLSLIVPPLTPFLTFIINQSLKSSIFPTIWKKADIIPIPKNSMPTEMSHYRPVSILPTISKILERVMLKQLNLYIGSISLLPMTQSGFRAKHSTSTALLDQKKIYALVLLDYSKAFDTLDHSILLFWFGWVCSKLSGGLFNRMEPEGAHWC